MYKLIVFTIISVILSGCSVANSPETLRYSIVSDVKASSLTGQYIVSVILSDELKTGGLVVRTSDLTVRTAQYHVWASGLDSQLSILLCEALESAGVSQNVSVDADVYRFEGSLNGRTYIEMVISGRYDGKEVFRHGYSYEGKQRADGYDPMVEDLRNGFRGIAYKAALGIKASQAK
ncbi:MAG: ABC-type transport auxiliary lipoprotein family protein [Succinatimonas hippei]|nr:ABC-type transport auxiliary lipoprotein family protein [Succinatimonas hippei]